MPLANFVGTTVLLGRNAYKSILFRAASFLLDFAVYKLFSYIAYRRQTFTSYLMFGEALVQKALYVFAPSPGARRGRIMVFAFILFIAAATLYDTMLWALDSPGYILRASPALASDVRDKLRPDAEYVVQWKGNPGYVDGINLQLDISEGLWLPGTNATLTGVVTLGTGKVVAAHNFSAEEPYPGPRIWLDDDGFSIALEYDPARISGFGCPADYDGDRGLDWFCWYDYYEDGTGSDYLARKFGIPRVWWDNEAGANNWVVGVERGGNPWYELSANTETLLMKEILTITRGKTRHVFLLSAFKATLVTQRNEVIPDYDIEDLVRRTWTDSDVFELEIDEVITDILDAKYNDTGLTMGWVTSDDDGHTLNAKRYQYTKTMGVRANRTTALSSTFFQVQTSSLKLLRSETIANETIPVEYCDGYFVSHANGGRPRYTTCSYDMRLGEQPSRYLGQMDTTALYLLTDTLGKTSANYSARVLNQTSWSWLQEHEAEIENYITARGYLLGVDPSLVAIETHTNIPGVSALQLLLVLLPVVLAVLSWLLVFYCVPAYYQASLFSVIVATTGGGEGSREPGYMTDPPDIQIVEKEKQVLLRTPTGLFFHDVDTTIEVKESDGGGSSSGGGNGWLLGGKRGVRVADAGAGTAGAAMVGVGAHVLRVAE